ncbi:hypothetical protein Tco_0216941 [Tanacetum coccineum]
MDSEATDASTQQNHEQIDEEFTTTAYPNVQENLKIPTEDQVIIEEPAISTGTLSSLQNLDKELSFTNQFFVEKPQEEEPKKTNTKSEVQSMVTVPIHKDTSSVPLMTSSVIDLTVSHPSLHNDSCTTSNINNNSHSNHNNNISSTTTTSTTTKHHISDLSMSYSKAVDEIVTDAADWEMQAPLRAYFRDLPSVDMKEILQQRMFEDKSYEAHEDNKNLYDALQNSLERDYSNQLLADLDEARKKKRKRRESPRTPPGSPHSQPPPPPPTAGASGDPGTSGASGSSQLPPPPPPPSTGTSGSAQYESTGFMATQETSPSDDLMQDDSILDEQVHLSNDDDSENDHPLKDNLRKYWWKPLPEEDRPSTPEPAWTIPCHSPSILDGGVSQDAHRSGHVTIQTQFFFNKDLEYLRYGSKGNCLVLSISKMKAASYPEFGLELLVPEQMWIDDVCTYDIKHSSDTYVFTMKMEILLEPTSNKIMVQVKIKMEIPRSSGVRFLTACSYLTDTSKDLMKSQVYVSKLPQL